MRLLRCWASHYARLAAVARLMRARRPLPRDGFERGDKPLRASDTDPFLSV